MRPHKRLSRNLADKGLEHNIRSNVLKLSSKRINENTLLIVDPSDIQKKYAKREMRNGDVREMGTVMHKCAALLFES